MRALLVDDVLTTGATLRALRGGASIGRRGAGRRGLTFARSGYTRWGVGGPARRA